MPQYEYYNPADEVERFSDDLNAKNKSAVEKHTNDKLYQKHYKYLNDTWTDGKYYKRVTITSYGSGQIGSRIRNAVTGQSYLYLVGSKDEDHMFKVIDAVGRNGRKEPLFLFYDTPEQYENHQFIKLGQEVKEAWYKKNLAARTSSK